MATLSNHSASKCDPTEFMDPNVGGVIVNHQNSLNSINILNFSCCPIYFNGFSLYKKCSGKKTKSIYFNALLAAFLRLLKRRNLKKNTE